MEPKVENKEVSPLQWIKGIGPKRAEALAAAGILSARDVLYYFPRAYIDRNAVPSLRALRSLLNRQSEGQIFPEEFDLSTETTIVVYVKDIRDRTIGKGRSMVVVTLDDGSGVPAEIVYWNQAQYFKKVFAPDMLISVSGKPELNRNGRVTFHHPEVERIEEEDAELYRSGRILPKYRSSQKMKSAGLSPRVMRNLVAAILDKELPQVRETLESELLRRLELPPLQDCIRELHFPGGPETLAAAKRRMKFEELFFFQLLMATRQRGHRTMERAVACGDKSSRARALAESLPFDLTGAQKRVINDIVHDMQQPAPMNRLLQGDVGSGKTIVALLAMLVAIDNGLQCAIMAPTEILAEQHKHSLMEFVKDLDVHIVQLVGGQKSKARRAILEEIASGKANIIVGTHAVFEDTVHYCKLGLVVIDEQHRFGVMQRARLKARAADSFPADETAEDMAPHILVMSATPIPRTLAMTAYGDLVVSVIDELPKNRKPIRTKVVFESQLDSVHEFIREQVRAGHQAYIVYPLVEKSEKLELKSAIEHYELLNETVFPDLKLGLLHGQMFWYEKEDAMRDFKNKDFQILVATTVVEVGIDVPNATVMLIENAERFGLSQLHQLRGRVGRGAEQSYCLLATKDHFRFHLKKREKDADEQKAAIIRLKTMEATTDGFQIAEVDLKLRGPGDMMGTRQSGLPEFNFANLVTDGELITLARREAFTLLERDPHLRAARHAAIRHTFLKIYQSDYLFLDVA